MRVLISGIGIGGPTLAYWLKRFGHEPVLVEKAPVLRTGGYIVDFWGLGYDIAERMGLVPELHERGYHMERLRMVDTRGRDTAVLDVTGMRDALGGRFVSVARSEISAAIVRACGDVRMRFGACVEELRADLEGVDVTLTGGARERVDVVVGADGLHSRVRELVFAPERNVERHLGCHVAAFRLPDYPHRDELTYVSHTVAGRHASRIALRGGDTLVLLVFRSALLDDGEPARAEQLDALRRVFRDAGWEVPEILARLTPDTDLYFDRVSQIHLPRWSAGRVALVGDAAACASLLAGEGAGLAMIEAFVLARELAGCGGDVGAAFAAYERRLRAFVEKKQKSALRFQGFFAPRTALGAGVVNLVMRVASVPPLGRLLLATSLRDDLALPELEAAARA